ncbi:MAG: SH3 domain-containing protein [Microthrixaceae bacterium]
MSPTNSSPGPPVFPAQRADWRGWAADREVSSNMRFRTPAFAQRRRSAIALLAAGAAMAAGCAGASDDATREVSVTTAPQATVAAGTEDGLRAPGATLPQVGGESAVPFDAEELRSTAGPAVAAVVARTCSGTVRPGTAFAVGDHHLVTTRSALAERANDAGAGIDPEPWLQLDGGSWVRGKVIGVAEQPNLAVIEVDRSLPRSLGWAEDRPAKDDWGAVVGFPARSDGGSELLAAKVTGATKGGETPSVNLQAAAAGRSGLGNMGAPFVGEDGKVLAMVVLADATGDAIVAQEASVLMDLTAGLIDEPTAKVDTSCAADSPKRLKVTWGLLLERDGSETEATQLGGRPAMAKYGRVGVVDSALPSFVADGASAAVVLGPFSTYKQAEKASSVVATTTKKLDLDGDAKVVLVPWDTFPAEAPAPPTTIPVAPPTTAPPPTAPPTTKKATPTTKKTATTTDERASSADCSGPRSVRVIRGAPAGYSYKMRSGPSKSAPAVALGANGKQVSVVSGSGTNGYVKIALPDGRCVWGASQYLG